MKTFTFFDMQQLKQRAKAAKETHPFFSSNQRLDLIARRDFGLRNYKEAKAMRDREIMKSVEVSDGGTARCSLCLLAFVHPLDAAEHNKHHEGFEEALHYWRYEPLGYQRREDIKQNAWRRLNGEPTPPVEARAKARLEIFRAWFDRSLLSQMPNGNWRKHPDFPTYVSMMLSAVELDEDEKVYLSALYGERPGVIAKGLSYWQG